MIVWFILYLLIIVLSSKIDKKNDYLSKDNTTIIKGIFIILVFFSHFNSYVTYHNRYDLLYLNIIGMIGQAMVAPFMFYSGYGIMEQISKKGNKYINSIPVKRIFTTLIKFDLAVLIFYVIAILNKNIVSLKQLLLSLVGWGTLGNSNWYIFTILVLYLITFISFKIVKNKNNGLHISMIITVIYVLILYYFKIKPSFWFDTALCYIVGMYYSRYKDKLFKSINYNNISYIVILLLTIIGCLVLKRYSYHISINILFNIGFSILIVIMTMKISINSRILEWCGRYLFEIYILQRIPMIIFKGISNINIYFIVSIVSTIVIVIIFKKISDMIVRKINKIN